MRLNGLRCVCFLLTVNELDSKPFINLDMEIGNDNLYIVSWGLKVQ